MLRAAKDRKYAYILLSVAAGLLAIGLVLKPGQTQPVPQQPKAAKPKPQVDLAELQELTQQRRMRDFSSYLVDSANDVASSLIYVDSIGRTALVWNGNNIIAPRQAGQAGGATAIAPGGQRVALAPNRAAPSAPFVFLTAGADSEAMMPVSVITKPLALGDWVLAVAKNSDNAVIFAHGFYQGHAASRCGSFEYDALESSAPLSDALVGGGLFTLDGRLLGFIAECGRNPVAVSAATIAGILGKPQTLNDQLQEEYGIRVADLAPADGKGTGPSVQVNAVWAKSVADSAGVKPGDSIDTIDGIEIHSSGDLKALANQPNANHTLDLRRGRRKIRVSLVPDRPSSGAPAAATDAADGAAPLGLTLGAGSADGQVVVLEVAPDSKALQAGILEGDILRRIGTKQVTGYPSAARQLAGLKGRPVVLTLERDRKEVEVLVSP